MLSKVLRGARLAGDMGIGDHNGRFFWGDSVEPFRADLGYPKFSREDMQL